MGITKPCTHLHPPPSTSTHLHPAPCISTKLISTSTQLRPPPPNSFQPARSSLQHPQSYKNQNIARNWGISPNLGKKFQNCLFFLKIGTHGILEELILHPDLVFQKSNPKINFWANLVRRSQNSPFCLKIGIHGILDELIQLPDLVFQNCKAKIHFWVNLGQKI